MNTLTQSSVMFPSLQWGAVICASLVATVSDLRSRRISNLLTLPLLLTGLAWSAYSAGLPGLLNSMAGTALVALPFTLLFVFAGGGAGDAKLMAGVGSWLGVRTGLFTLAAVCLAGATIGLLMMAFRGRLRIAMRGIGLILWQLTFRLLGARCDSVSPPAGELVRMPFAPAIFAGVCLAALGAMLWHM